MQIHDYYDLLIALTLNHRHPSVLIHPIILLVVTLALIIHFRQWHLIRHERFLQHYLKHALQVVNKYILPLLLV